MHTSRTEEQYWKDYDGLQAAKHQLLARYLDRWFPILSAFRGRVFYIDCHAGRGMHDTGDPGSPIVALQRLLNHKLRTLILNRVEVHFEFFEIDKQSAGQLEAEIAQLGQLPKRTNCNVYAEDYAQALAGILDYLDGAGLQIAPSFAFLDPFGFKLSMSLQNRFLSAGPTEILTNFMYRYIDMAVHKTDKEDILDELWGRPDWRKLRSISDKDVRYREAVQLFADSLEAKFVSWLVMRGVGGEVKYTLFHATNHLKGRREFKDAMWEVVPDGTFTAFERDRPEQGVLFGKNVPVPLERVRELLYGRFAGETVRLEEDIYPIVDASPYRLKHATDVLRDEVRAGRVVSLDDPGKFVIKRNPRLQFGL